MKSGYVNNTTQMTLYSNIFQTLDRWRCMVHDDNIKYFTLCFQSLLLS